MKDCFVCPSGKGKIVKAEDAGKEEEGEQVEENPILLSME